MKNNLNPIKWNRLLSFSIIAIFLTALTPVVNYLIQCKVDEKYIAFYKDQPEQYAIPAALQYTGYRMVETTEILTKSYLCLIIIVVVLFSAMCHEMKRTKRVSKLSDLPDDKALLFPKKLADPVGLSCKIEKRINELKDKKTKSHEISMDFLFLEEHGMIGPRKRKYFRDAYLSGVIHNSFFSEEINKISKVLNNENDIHHDEFTKEYNLRETIYMEFDVSINEEKIDAGNKPEKQEKSEKTSVD